MDDFSVLLQLAHFRGIRLAFSAGGTAAAETSRAAALVEQTRSVRNMSFMRLFYKGV